MTDFTVSVQEIIKIVKQFLCQSLKQRWTRMCSLKVIYLKNFFGVWHDKNQILYTAMYTAILYTCKLKVGSAS